MLISKNAFITLSKVKNLTRIIMFKPNFLLLFPVIVIIVGLVNGQVIFERSCPLRNIVFDFKLTEYMGEWYELQRYQQVNQGNGECVTANYTLLPETQRVHISNIMRILPQNEIREIVGSGRLPSPNANPLPGQFLVQFPGSLTREESNYWILGTDYTGFAVIWACVPVNQTHSAESAWILSRTKSLPINLINYVDRLIDNNLDRTSLRSTDQSEKTCGKASGAMLPKILLLAVLGVANLLK